MVYMYMYLYIYNYAVNTKRSSVKVRYMYMSHISYNTTMPNNGTVITVESSTVGSLSIIRTLSGIPTTAFLYKPTS